VSRSDRECAQRISEYVDGLVVHRREDSLPAFTEDDREFRELTALSRTLSAIQFLEPHEFREHLRDHLRHARQAEVTSPQMWLCRRFISFRTATWSPLSLKSVALLRHGVRTAATMAPLIALVAAFIWQVAGTRAASAAEILGRADATLAKLVQHGQILHRRWKVTERVKTPAGGLRIVRQSMISEWMDGADFSRVAGRNESDGRVYLAYASAREKGEVKPRVYFAPGFADEPDGLLSIEPSRREFQEALAGFEPEARARLQTYLDRGYIFEPISGERRFNRIALQTSTERRDALPRIMVSLREETLPTGTDVYAVRIVDPARVRFRWKSRGAPAAWLEWRETVRYIARDTYLSLGAEETYQTENGHRMFQTRELLETRIVERDAIGVDPFLLSVPKGTPVRRQLAADQLSAVAAVLENKLDRFSRTDGHFLK
jgi:hypothetical protein